MKRIFAIVLLASGMALAQAAPPPENATLQLAQKDLEIAQLRLQLLQAQAQLVQLLTAQAQQAVAAAMKAVADAAPKPEKTPTAAR